MARNLKMPDLAFLMCIIGRRKSGKSSLCIDLLTDPKYLNHKFEKIIFISPTIDLDTTWKDCSIDFDDPNIEVFTEFRQDQIEEIIEVQREHVETVGSENADSILLVLDDCLADKEFKMKGENHLFKIANNGRHLKISIIVLAQKITGIPTEIRSQADSMFVFATNSQREITNLRQDCDIDKYTMGLATGERYTFIHALNEGGRMRIYNSAGQLLQ